MESEKAETKAVEGLQQQKESKRMTIPRYIHSESVKALAVLLPVFYLCLGVAPRGYDV